jgi:hypothetical protein
MVAEEYNNQAGVYKVQTFGTTHKRGAEDFYKKAIAVGDAKAWNVLLDKSRQGKRIER